jgi:hypothetical protein
MALGQYKDSVEVVHKVLIGIGLTMVAAYLTFVKDEYEKEKFCFATKSTLLSEASGKKFDQSGVASRIELMEKLCPNGIDNFTKVLMQVASERLAVCMGEACNAAETASGEPPKTTTPAKPTDSRTGGASSLQGWLAVGFVDPRVFSETNFDVASVTTHGAVTPLSRPIAPGTILKARWEVNVRRAAADWNDPLGIIDIGQCVRVGEVRDLKAGDRRQTWARVEKIDCDAALKVK